MTSLDSHCSQRHRMVGLDTWSFADFHAHSVGKQDDFVTPSFLLFPAMHKLPLRGGREGGDRDGREARASKSNFLFLKKESPNPERGRTKREGEEQSCKQEETQKGQGRSFVGLPACLIATPLPCSPFHLGNRYRQTRNAKTRATLQWS